MKRIILLVLLAVLPSFASAATSYFRGKETWKPVSGKAEENEAFVMITISDKKDVITQSIIRRTATTAKDQTVRRELIEVKKGLDGSWTSTFGTGNPPVPTVVSFAGSNLVSVTRVATIPNGRKASVNVIFPHPRVFQTQAVITEANGTKVFSTSLEAGEVLESQYKRSIANFKIEDSKPGAGGKAAQKPAGAPAAPQKK